MNIISEYCPKNCVWLNLTEEKQNLIEKTTGQIISHTCLKYNIKLYHMLAHPDLYKCEPCYNENKGESNE